MSETCSLDTRRAVLLRSKLNGLDEVEVANDRRTLLVRFFHDAPLEITAANLRITGGVAVRHIRIIDLLPVSSDDPDVPVRLEVALDRTGDASTYHLHVSGIEGIDQRYTDAPFLFFPDADDGLDCGAAVAPASADVAVPGLDYLAKDYPGFRQVMLDRLAVTLPDWQESHVPDVGIMLVELLAYVADRLSYYQDAVATEAYLATARRRISVRRHVRLIDYAMHEGCNARTLMQIDPAADGPVTPSKLTFLLAGQDNSVQFLPFPVPGDRMELRKAHTTMTVHRWGDADCVLPKGAVSATLVDASPQDPPSLRPGDFLILEVVASALDPAPEPDPRDRHPVRLTSVTPMRDELLDMSLLQVTWGPEDALPADMPLDSPTGGPVTMVLGNLLLVDQGRLVSEGNRSAGTPVLPMVGPGRRRTITLSTPGLAFGEPLSAEASAQKILVQRDPRQAVALITRLRSWPADDPSPAASATDWVVRPDLIESGPDDPDVTVEVDDNGVAFLRFGDGVCGRDPAGQVFEITYRVGNGTAGNVGADSLTRLVDAEQPPIAGASVRNPLPAAGGTDPEDVQQVKLLAPSAFQNTLMRAITADDYATLAAQLVPAVQRAVCSLIPVGGRELARSRDRPLRQRCAG